MPSCATHISHCLEELSMFVSETNGPRNLHTLQSSLINLGIEQEI